MSLLILNLYYYLDKQNKGILEESCADVKDMEYEEGQYESDEEE